MEGNREDPTLVAEPMVSIIIDNYNYARFLARCIESAVGQTYRDTEVVVVDDASTDCSREIIGQYPGVVPVLKHANGGQASALNAGFRASHGRIVMFVDSDDYLEPYAVERIVSEWRPGTAKIQYRLKISGPDGNLLDLFPHRDIPFDSGDVVPLLLRQGRYYTAVTSGNAFYREVLERILPIPEAEFRISADGYLVTLAPLFGTVLSIEEPLGTYRMHDQNAWATLESADGDRFRRAIRLDEARYRALAKKAEELGLPAPVEPGMNDWLHLEKRLCSLCVEPQRHPVPSDSRARLGWRGLWASKNDTRLPWRRRAMLAAWFLSAGLLPAPVAMRAVVWRMSPAARPWLVTKMLRLIRGPQRHAPILA